jgi:hypothetical protein
MDWTQVLGQVLRPAAVVSVVVLLRQRPVTFRFGSTARTEVQQVSPEAVSHWLESVQARGHLDAGKHMWGV